MSYRIKVCSECHGYGGHHMNGCPEGEDIDEEEIDEVEPEEPEEEDIELSPDCEVKPRYLDKKYM